MLAPQWSQLLDRVAAAHPVVKRTEDWICLGWPVESPEQTIQVTCVEAHGLMRVLVVADICPASEISERDALELAAKLLVGAVYIRKGLLAMRVVLTEGQFDLAQLHLTIDVLRANAVRYRAKLMKKKARAAAGAYGDDRY